MRKQQVHSDYSYVKAVLVVATMLSVALIVGNLVPLTTGNVLGGVVYKLGDANHNGDPRDDEDLALFLELKMTGVVPEGMNLKCSDINKDNKLDELDYEEFVVKIYDGKQDLGEC